LDVGVSLVVPWTARLAVACYLARLAVDTAAPSSPERNRRARVAWTVGCVVFLAHVAAAFHFVHGWSHIAAYEHTRRQTLALTGWDSGVGLYFNYVFAAWWLLDALAWWQWNDWPNRRWAYWPLQAYFGFIVFNGAVVFGPRGWLIVGTLVVTTFMSLWLLRRRRTPEVCG
jgi:hypothetical protein